MTDIKPSLAAYALETHHFFNTLCACNHNAYLHDFSLAGDLPFCSVCDCKNYITDNLEWLRVHRTKQ